MKPPQPNSSSNHANGACHLPAAFFPSATPWRDPLLHLFISAILRQSPALAQHGRRVQSLAMLLGTSLHLPQSDLDIVTTAALLHDLGKTFIVRSILNKIDPLTHREWHILQEHPTISAHLCDALPTLYAIRQPVENHHEHLDGSGYPNHRSGPLLCLATQVIQIADLVDTVTSAQPYKSASPLTHALTLMTTEAEQGWRDPSLIRHCKSILQHTDPTDRQSLHHISHSPAVQLDLGGLLS